LAPQPFKADRRSVSRRLTSKGNKALSRDPLEVLVRAIDSPEMCGFAGDRVYQAQECDPFGLGLWGKEAQLRGAAFLGPEGTSCRP
jgi:hypothetical protein